MCINLLFLFINSLISTFLNYFLSYFKLFYSLLRKGWWYTSSIINNNNIRMCLATYTHPTLSYLAIFSYAPSFSTVLSHYVSLSFFLLNTFSFSWDFSTYQLNFSVFWAWSSWIFCVTFHFVSEFLTLVIFRMLWMLVTVNKVKHVALHGSHVLQITSWKTVVQTFFDVSNEKSPILITIIG